MSDHRYHSITELGDTLETGVPVPAIGKVVDPNNIEQTTVIRAGKPDVLPSNPNVFGVPEDLTIIPVQKDALKTFAIGADINNNNTVVNLIGDTVPTGVSIPAEGKVVPCKQPHPVNALQPDMKAYVPPGG